MTRYQHLANLLAERIEQGLYRHGEKLPSVRSLSQEHGVSISTVQQAYQTLEQRQLITPQPRSATSSRRKKPSRRCHRCHARYSARWRSPSGIRC